MLESLDLDVYLIDDVFFCVANSDVSDGSVIFELPPEQCPRNAADAVLGDTIFRVALRCRKGTGIQGFSSDEVAQTLGFKSNADIRKKLIPCVVSRRHGNDHFIITPMRRHNKSQIVFSGEQLHALIDDREQIGRAVRSAMENAISA